MRVRRDLLSGRVLRFHGSVRALRRAIDDNVRRGRRGMRAVRLGSSVQRHERHVRMHRRVLPERLLQRRRDLRGSGSTVEHGLRLLGQRLRSVQPGRSVRRGRVLVWGHELQRLLRQRPMRDPGLEPGVRRERRRMRGVRSEPGMQHARHLRVRRQHMPERLLRRHRQLPDVEQRHLRDRRRRVHGVQRQSTVRRDGPVRLQHEIVPRWLLRGLDMHGPSKRVARAMRRGRRHLRGVCPGAALRRHGSVRVRRNLMPHRLLRRDRSMPRGERRGVRDQRRRVRGMR
jgi:hypothetical protein